MKANGELLQRVKNEAQAAAQLLTSDERPESLERLKRCLDSGKPPFHC